MQQLWRRAGRLWRRLGETVVDLSHRPAGSGLLLPKVAKSHAGPGRPGSARSIVISPLAMNSRNPTAGTLEARPLYQVLIAALDRGLSGTLVLEAKDRTKNAVTLVDGRVAKIKSATGVARLGTVCVGAGLVTKSQLEQVIAADEPDLLGEALVRAGLLDDDQLQHMLTEQVLQQIDWLAKLPPETVFGFYPNKDFLRQWGGPDRTIEPLQVIWACVRGSDLSRAFVDNTLASLGDSPIRLHPMSRVARFGFSKREQALVDVLRAKPQPVRSLLASGVVPPADARRILTTLILTRHVDIGANLPPVGVALLNRPVASERPRDLIQRTSTMASTARRVTSEPAPDELKERRDALNSEAEALLNANYYELLGVPSDAPVAVVQSAFLGKAKQWHPDKLDPALSEAKPLVTKVFSRMTEAHQVLTQTGQRAEYDKVLAGNGVADEEHAEVQRVLKAASTFQKAEVLVKRGEWVQALDAAKKAAEGDPEQAEYEGLYCWLLARQINGGSKEEYLPIVERLVKAVKQQPNNVAVRLYRARVLKLAGLVNEAMRDFRSVVEAQPNHVEAQRELRLHRMRTGSQEAEDVGLFGRLFKKS